jgi:lipopolysaccharide export system permease protein
LTTRKDDPEAGRIRAELLDRFTNPLYALTFGMIALAALGKPRTTRQGRSGAMVTAVVAVLLIRVAGFGVSNLAVRLPGAVPLAYLVPLLGLAGGWWWLFGLRALMPRRGTARLLAGAA